MIAFVIQVVRHVIVSGGVGILKLVVWLLSWVYISHKKHFYNLEMMHQKIFSVENDSTEKL